MGSSQKRLAWLGAWTARLAACGRSRGQCRRSRQILARFSGSREHWRAARRNSNRTRGAPSLRAIRGHRLSKPKAPAVVLYDQYDNPARTRPRRRTSRPRSTPTTTSWPTTSSCPRGQTWNINQVDVAGVYYNGAGPGSDVNLRFYNNACGLPGRDVATRHNLAMTDTGGSFVIPIPSPVIAGPGHLLGLGAGEHGLHPRRPVGLDRPHRPVESALPGRTRAAASASAA